MRKLRVLDRQVTTARQETSHRSQITDYFRKKEKDISDRRNHRVFGEQHTRVQPLHNMRLLLTTIKHYATCIAKEALRLAFYRQHLCVHQRGRVRARRNLYCVHEFSIQHLLDSLVHHPSIAHIHEHLCAGRSRSGDEITAHPTAKQGRHLRAWSDALVPRARKRQL